jgi:hypothetical protein
MLYETALNVYKEMSTVWYSRERKFVALVRCIFIYESNENKGKSSVLPFQVSNRRTRAVDKRRFGS